MMLVYQLWIQAVIVSSNCVIFWVDRHPGQYGRSHRFSTIISCLLSFLVTGLVASGLSSCSGERNSSGSKVAGDSGVGGF